MATRIFVLVQVAIAVLLVVALTRLGLVVPP
jgi:hypothetical protein